MEGIQLNLGYDGDLLAAWDDTANAQKVQQVIHAEVGPCPDPLVQYVDAVGDGSGSVALNVDGSTPATFLFAPAAARIARVWTIVFGMISATQPEPDEFQDATALTNGINIFATISTAVVTLCGGVPIKDNLGVSVVFDHAGRPEFLGTKKLGVYVMEFHGEPLRLIGEDGDSLSVVIQDNLSALESINMMVKGMWEK